jgi:catechol 2,3-dioxygenase
VPPTFFRDAGLEIDLGPGMHGMARSFYLYLREPVGGHRVEIYAGGYHVFEPDWEPIEWCEPRELADGMTWFDERMVRGADGGHAMDVTLPCTPELAEVNA